MKLSVRLFAGLRDLVGSRDVELELADGATVADLRDELSSRYPAVIPIMGTLVCAVNEDYVSNDHRLSPGDDVALVPPVSGGSPPPASDRFQVTEEALDPQRLTDLVRCDEAGAVVLFHGVVRNHSQGRRVLHLEYDAYPSMALKKMRQVAEEVRSRWSITDIAISHRIGRLGIGETSLLVAVSAPHRREALEACHHAVDRIKEIVPIWKKETWEGGESWVEGHPVTVTKTARSAGRSDRGSAGAARREGAAPDKR